MLQMIPHKGKIIENSDAQINIIFKPKSDETIKQVAFCHIHRIDTGEHLKTLKLKILG